MSKDKELNDVQEDDQVRLHSGMKAKVLNVYPGKAAKTLVLLLDSGEVLKGRWAIDTGFCVFLGGLVRKLTLDDYTIVDVIPAIDCKKGA